MVAEAIKLYRCFVDCQKAFDGIEHVGLLEVMERAKITDLERRLIINLYWRQNAAGRWDGKSDKILS